MAVLVVCPKCGAPMRKKEGKYGTFWGCTKYPRCMSTLSPDKVRENHAKSPTATSKPFEPSPYQLRIFEFIQSGSGSAVVEAVAGSGKTTTIVKALEITPKTSKVLFLAFNVHIKDELARRAPAHVRVSTLHSLGFSALRNGLPNKPQVDEDKLFGIVKEVLPDSDDSPLYSPLMSLVALCKGTLIDVENPTELAELAERHGIDTNGSEDRLYTLVPTVMRMCMERTSVVDYDDMVWLPIVLNMRLETYDWVFVDESQDLNKAQIQLVLRSMRPHTGRVIAVGDRRQSIYGFRGADTSAIPNIIEALGATVLPLSISYRCPVSHVNLAKEIVPQIEAAPGAKVGLVEETSYMKFLTCVGDGDLVLCRVNAPLVTMAYALLKMGKKVVLRGRDFGKGLITFVDKMKATSIPDLIEKVNKYKDVETMRLEAAGRSTQSLNDKCECVIELCEGVANLSDLRVRITSVFDDETKTGIIGSSVHRAKGDESHKVWILKPELIPHPLASQEWQVEQELNLKYVALTRSKLELIFVNGM